MSETDRRSSSRGPLGRVAVIIPTYNERENLESIAARVRSAVPAADLLVVDDNSPDGTGERLITSGWEDEGPTWAPNGRVLMFTRELESGRGAQIWSVDVTGRNERRVLTPGDASDPAWSPLIQ